MIAKYLKLIFSGFLTCSTSHKQELSEKYFIQSKNNFYLCLSCTHTLFMLKIKLNVLGLSVSQTQTGAYALVLSEDNGDRRIPIIIGPVEAQSIAIQLEGLHPPRPLTHDLFKNIAHAFQIELIEVIIYKLEEGIFFSELICEQNGSRIAIDSRTSDAVALALRFKCPIYTTEEILSKAGIVIEVSDGFSEDAMPDELDEEDNRKNKYELYSVKELEQLLHEAVQDEKYEMASEIRDEISRRKEGN
jgi:bifunctional DNase/RNase